ncbi:MAG TPA: GNAT family N-acetyltransferase [Solirubrobacterales bacterium]|nr:GNAT family N-acetyltransferase [Solirubrobacterales bacterium]
MTRTLDRRLYDRAVATLVSSWETIAGGSTGAAIQHLRGVTAAVFPNEPERSIYNNAVLDRDLGPEERGTAIEGIRAAYGEAGVGHYAAWVHESDAGTAAELGSMGYAIAESTRVMGMQLGATTQMPVVLAEIGPADWATYLGCLRHLGLSETLLAGVDPEAFHVLAARLDGAVVATALGFDHDGDCGIFNMSTLEPARRQGIATALTAHHLREAAERGCETATLQSTPMAEGVYASLGFRDLGRFLEYTPG